MTLICDISYGNQSVTYRYQEFQVSGICHFLVVSEPVLEKIGTGKKSRNRYRSNLVSEKSLGTGIGKIWYRKKVPVSVSKIFSTGKKYRYRYRPTFWLPSHTAVKCGHTHTKYEIYTLCMHADIYTAYSHVYTLHKKANCIFTSFWYVHIYVVQVICSALCKNKINNH